MRQARATLTCGSPILVDGWWSKAARKVSAQVSWRQILLCLCCQVRPNCGVGDNGAPPHHLSSSSNERLTLSSTISTLLRTFRGAAGLFKASLTHTRLLRAHHVVPRRPPFRFPILPTSRHPAIRQTTDSESTDCCRRTYGRRRSCKGEPPYPTMDERSWGQDRPFLVRGAGLESQEQRSNQTYTGHPS